MENSTILLNRREAAGALALGVVTLLAETVPAHAGAPALLPRCLPEEAGVDPAGILAFVEATDRISARDAGGNGKSDRTPPGLHSLMLLRHGKVVAEGWWHPYAARHPHMLYSLSKSFTSTAVGLAISDGLLSTEDTVTSFFPDRAPAAISDNLAAMKVRHLLTMSAGHERDATGPTVIAPDGDWARAFLGLPVPKEPGSLFVYNSAATYMLSAIVQKRTGKTVLDFLTPRLFRPLGFDHPTWATCPKGINTGGWGLSIRTEEIARFGQLYLQGGMWKGARLLPEAWVAEATTKKIANGNDPNSDWAQGYCYQFWRCRHGAFRGDGAFGQYCVVMPEQDAVVAITSGLGDMQSVLNLVWEYLLPAMHPDSSAAKGESPSDAALRARLRGLALPAPTGSSRSDTAARVSGKVYQFGENPQKIERLSITFAGGEAQLVLLDGKGERTVRCGTSKWLETRAPIGRELSMLSDQPAARAAAQGAWTDPETFRMRLCFYESPFVQTLTLKFKENSVEFIADANVGPPPAPPVTGRAVT